MPNTQYNNMIRYKNTPMLMFIHDIVEDSKKLQQSDSPVWF